MQKEITLNLTIDFTETVARLLEHKPYKMSLDEFYHHILAVARLRGIEPLETKTGFDLVILNPDNFISDLRARFVDLELNKK